MIERRKLGSAWAAVLFLACFAALVTIRLQLVTSQTGLHTGCDRRCFAPVIFSNDATVLGCLVLLLAACCLRLRYTRPLLVGAGLVLLLAYVLDLFVFMLLNHRLDIGDVFKYAGDVSLDSHLVLPVLDSGLGISSVLAGLGCAVGFVVLATQERRRIAAALVLAVLSAGMYGAKFVPRDIGHVSKTSFDDIISHNLPDGEDAPYTPAFEKRLAQLPELAQQCEPGAAAPSSVILLVVESLSLFQSRYLSGIKDWTPEIDRLATRYSYLDQFYANGFTTDGGLVSLLTGHVPLPNLDRYKSMQAYIGFDHPQQNALQQLQQHGFDTFYFRSADLGFIGTGDWLRHLGFSHVEGPENAFYQGMRRGSFNDPGDHALYQRFLHWYDTEQHPHPFFSVVQTTTMHPPFVIPESGVRDEEQSVRYADHAIGEFVAGLEQRGFFKHGILFITGDHRSMTVRRPGEWEKLGKDAIARVPALVIGNARLAPGKVPGRWQQTDFLPSLLEAAGLPSCTTAFEGRFLGHQVPAQYVMHAEGVERDHVLVRVKDDPRTYEVQLDGDKTAWVNAPRGPAGQIVLDEVNRERAFRPRAQADLTLTLLRMHGLTHRALN
ncbi:LTA synthase family protein [Xylophilus sp. ASV27]|uniref:LTA synthase family protein n=1 Tax=Xylophilus sp. ASV27 TaxID=2795129 RepID=UPI0018EC6934|nr:LTA synthase family protein [Xylophilus sp. ASV27]